jgi:hypothetical protein
MGNTYNIFVFLNHEVFLGRPEILIQVDHGDHRSTEFTGPVEESSKQ